MRSLSGGGYCSFNWLLPLRFERYQCLDQRFSQNISFTQGGPCPREWGAYSNRGSKTEVVNPFSYLIILSKQSRETTVFDVLALRALPALQVCILRSKNHNAGPDPSLG